MIKENPNNRALLLKLFGKEWLNKRDQYFKDILEIRETKQLKLF